MNKLSTRLKTGSAVLLGAVAMLSNTAGADETSDGDTAALSSGFYAEIRGSATFLEDSANGANAFTVLGSRTNFDTGFGVSGAIGRDLSRFLTGSLTNFRAEAEIAYNENGIEGSPGNPEISATAYMANLYYDFQTADAYRNFVPYIGVGVGAATLESDGIALADDEDTVFAYQVRAGLNYRVRPGLLLSLGYRFFDTQDPEFRSALGNFESEYRSHAVEAGLRFRF
jgi:opacity protein-like surface antigen